MASFSRTLLLAIAAAASGCGTISFAQTQAVTESTQTARPSAADIGITAMMQMLRDEGIDIDSRMAQARTNCRNQVLAEAVEAAPDEIEAAVEECAVVEEGIIYARAINEMNANRVDNFNDAMARHNAEVAEAARKQREYELEVQAHNAQVAEIERQQRQYEQDLAAHGALLADGGFSDAPAVSQPAQQQNLAQNTAPPQSATPQPRPDQTTPAQPGPVQTASVSPTARQPAIREQAPPPATIRSRVIDSGARTASRSTVAAAPSPSPSRGRVLSRDDSPYYEEDIELDIMEATGPRIALVIGNENYVGSMGSLSNPVNDAVLIGATLRSLGFDVEILTDASQLEMKRAVQRLGDRLADAGDNATGLFFYAGHGVQSGGNNYLIPVGSVVDSESDLELEAVAADAILAQMEEAYVSTRIVILDACRNMPLRRRTRNGARGLARMETPNGSFVAYSTSPGSTAADGGGIHSPFAEALSEQMLIPDRPIEVTFREVRKQVVELTGGEQVPWDSSSLLDTFSFAETR